MDWADLQLRIQTLPYAFRRPGTTYTQLENSLIAGMDRFSGAADGLTGQETFANASGSWLDVWGLLFGVPRFGGEVDPAYKTRITETLLAWRGTVPAIENFALTSLGISLTVTEDLAAGPGWSGDISASATFNVNLLSQAVDFVRPAGVPFSFIVSKGGFYIGTSSYIGSTLITGSYVITPTQVVQSTTPPSTNNASPSLPTTYLTDPTINPSLASTTT